MCGYSTISQNSFKNESGYSTETSKDCGNSAILSGFHDDRFSDDFNDRNDNGWNIDLAQIKVNYDEDLSDEISDEAYQAIEAKISQMISDAVTYAISEGLRGAVTLKSTNYNTQ